MSKYTTQVRFICETFAGYDESKGYKSIEEILDKSWKEIFDFDFPIFDEEYRGILCKNILRHYYTREIGEETVGLWKLRLSSKLKIIMPYYNKLYLAWNEVENPFTDTNLVREHVLKHQGETSGTQNVDSSGKQTERYSETPQGSLQDIETNEYLTNATITDSNQEGNSKFEQLAKNTDEYIEKVIGKSGGQSYIELMTKYKDYIINIDNMVIDELNNCFMLLW